MKKIKIISGILSAAFVLLSLSIFITEKYTDYGFLAYNIDGGALTMFFAVCAAVCLLISTITAIISKDEKSKVLGSAIKALCICFICLFAAITAPVNKSSRYYEFSSPDGKHTVIAEEWSYLQGGGIDFYERVNPLIVKYKECFSTDDSYRAISSGDYSVDWGKNIMQFTAQNGNRIYKTTKIAF